MGYPDDMDILCFDRRPVFLIALLSLLGICTVSGENKVWAIILALVLAAGAWYCRTRGAYILAALILALGFGIYGIVFGNVMDRTFEELNGTQCSFNARVVSVAGKSDRNLAVVARPEGHRFKLKLYIPDPSADIIQGDEISFTGSLIKPGGPTNPGGYDERKSLYSDGITAIVFVKEGCYKIDRSFSLMQVFGLIRSDITNTCVKLLGNERGWVMSGMLIGDKTGLSREVRSGFINSGLAHTMAVSGAHVAYVLLPLMYLFSKLGIARKKYYPWLIVLLFFFSALTGFTPSVSRASITAGLMLLSSVIYMETDALNSLAVSAFILMLVNPYCIYDAGFILSYACVLSIMLFYPAILKMTGRNPIARLMALTMAVQIGIIPMTAGILFSIQPLAVISNLLIFPVRAAASAGGWFIYFVSLLSEGAAELLSYPVGALTDSIIEVAGIYGGSIISSINVPHIPFWLVVIYYAVTAIILMQSKFRFVLSSAGFAVIAIYMMFFSMPADTYVFFDTGQADSFLIKTDQKRDVLIDTGRYSPGNPIAYYCGDYIDFIFITHSHEDHIGGLESILSRYRVGVVYIPGCRGAGMGEVIRLCGRYGVKCVEILAGAEIKIDGYMIEVLNPFDYDYEEVNDTSLVLRVTAEDVTLLYTGDIEFAAQLYIMSSGNNLKADIFKVPHHGAARSAYEKFYDSVSADISVISCGYNYFGHPSDECIDLLKSTDIYRTDLHGAVIIKAVKNGYRVETCRGLITAD